MKEGECNKRAPSTRPKVRWGETKGAPEGQRKTEKTSWLGRGITPSRKKEGVKKTLDLRKVLRCGKKRRPRSKEVASDIDVSEGVLPPKTFFKEGKNGGYMEKDKAPKRLDGFVPEKSPF